MKDFLFSFLLPTLLPCVVFAAGSFYPQPISFVVGGLAVFALGLFQARWRHGPNTGYVVGINGAFTLGQFTTMTQPLERDLPVYVANPDIAPASGIYLARFDGQRVLIVERAAKEIHDKIG